MQRLLIATTNQGKLGEFKKLLSGLPIELVSLVDLGITQDFEEKGETFAENSEEKARHYAKLSGLMALSDDGGLEIEALDGAPGVHSKRWAGEDATDEMILAKMKEVAESLPDENRGATFSSVVTIAFPDGSIIQERGIVKGVIAKTPRQNLLKGFPYRSYLYLPELKKYYHDDDLSEEEKKMYNHRYKAVERLKPRLIKALEDKV